MTDYLKCFKEYGLSSHPYRQSGRSYNLASYDFQSANSLTVFFYNYTLTLKKLQFMTQLFDTPV